MLNRYTLHLIITVSTVLMLLLMVAGAIGLI